MNAGTMKVAWCGLVLAGMAAGAMGDTVIIRNKGTNHIRLSDLYAFSGPNNTGTRTAVMRKNNNADDVNIAINGRKSITVPDGTRSVTVSMRKKGKEIESDINVGTLPIDLAYMTPMGANPDVAVVFDDAGGPLPAIGAILPVLAGKFADPQYDWITFYDASANDGFVQRHGSGAILSPLWSSGEMLVEHHYDIRVTPTPASAALLGGGVLMCAGRRRHRA